MPLDRKFFIVAGLAALTLQAIYPPPRRNPNRGERFHGTRDVSCGSLNEPRGRRRFLLAALVGQEDAVQAPVSTVKIPAG
jgi:hypothetical protein